MGKTGEDSLDVAALLHGDDPHLVLLVHPQQEDLGLVVEDATALGPVTLHTGGNEVAVSRHEEEVVVNELLAHLLVHSGQGVVGAGKAAGQLGEGVLQKALNSQPLLLGDAGGQTEKIKGNVNAEVPVHSTRVRVGRSIDGFGLSPGITKEQRLGVESLLKNALSKLTGDLAGTYYPLTG